MTWRYRVQQWVARQTGFHILRTLPRGIDVCRDIQQAFPRYVMEVIFDVGANLGQSAQQYRYHFPDATLYCFEPVAATFQALQAQLGRKPGVHCIQLALGAQVGTARMRLVGSSDRFSMIGDQDMQALGETADLEAIAVSTVEQFCQTQKIQQISYLKIDTEGRDWEVLMGSESMLLDQRIDFVEVEAGMNPMNQFHVPLARFKDHLEAHQYVLFGLYDQMHEWPTRSPQLRRANLVFVSQKVLGSPLP
ncbi:FkbM family methyltransferase [Lyngbya confervoides]|uniref:FkbM family methyltransferase n=1 Tax=Lyngbya confervoides BDU141951 TaxID=1574623 RepID=A0ABD4SZV8_9CYAN|nr:FkbM family methyltransferase [Lyngbya confervoides]MCM1981716.1 FkbM family methyltransferase [Lyngbya confervoides BDU141951]